MDFRGHLRLPADAGTGIPVVLRVDDIYIVITSDGEELGSWRADEMSVERIFSNQFALDLAGESMVFLAADPLGFAYEGVTTIEELQGRLTKRRVFKKKKSAAKTAPEVDIQVEAPSEVVDPQPLWTPPDLKSVTEPGKELPIVPADPFEPGQRDRDEAPPNDSRVVYPAGKAFEPDPVAVEEPVAEPGPVVELEPVAVEESVAEPEPVVELESVAVEESVAEPEPVVESDPEALPEPVAESPPEPEPSLFEVELEIEEVGLATSGGSWIEPESLSPEPGPEPEFESVPEVETPAAEIDGIEIEDYEPAAAASIEAFVAPAGEVPGVMADDEAAVEETEAEVRPESVTEPVVDPVAEPEPLPEADPVAEAAPVAEAEPLPEAAPEPLPEAAEAGQWPEVAAPEPEPLAETEPSEADTLNGHRGESPRAKRPSLFRRDKKPAPHDHVYGEPKTIGGLKRSVCDTCGHVTFSGEDVYQGW